MRNLWIACLGVLMILGLVGCGIESGKMAEKAASAPAQSAQADSKVPAAKGKILVAYFSATGHTRTLAENTAKALNADLYEIRPEVPYSKEDLNYNDETTRATVEQKNDSARPKLADKNAPIANYDTIVLAYPIWWGQAPRILDTFVESYDFSGKTIIPFATSGGSGMGRTVEVLKSLCPSANWKGGKVINNMSEKALADWADSL